MLSRRAFLGNAALAAGGGLLAGVPGWEAVLDRALAASPLRNPRLHDIEHVVILMQENRSFDHYFGTLRGVRGFSDPGVVTTAGRSAFDQVDPGAAANPSGHVLPFRLGSAATAGQCVADQSHAWSVQHFSWNQGAMDGFVSSHRAGNGSGSDTGALTMGYYAREDIPLHYALADAFTICDGYFSSVFGPTNPNRIMSMSGTIDAEGTRGGPCIDNGQSAGQLRWTSYPELLQRAGISWFVYQESNNDTNNMLPYFAGFSDRSTDLYRRGNTIIPTPQGQRLGPALAARLKADVLTGQLPKVSWILASDDDCEHPEAAPNAGARFVSSVLDARTSDPEVWAKTVVFYTFDENDGFFDHVVPPTPPAGTPGEYLSAAALAKVDPSSSFGISGPVGLGFRVPMLVISPFSRGGRLCGDTFDHTSLLRFLEARFGVPVPNLSAWRRANVGDLTATLRCLARPDTAIPRLPDADALATASAAACKTKPPPAVPADQRMPRQEPGSRPGVTKRCPPRHLAIRATSVPRRRRRLPLRVRVRISHTDPLRSVRADINGRRIITTHKDHFTIHVRARLLRRGRNRLLIAARDDSGARTQRVITFSVPWPGRGTAAAAQGSACSRNLRMSPRRW